MDESERQASVEWLTAASWASFMVFTATAALVATSLKGIGSEFGLSLAQRGALELARTSVLAVSTLGIGCIADRIGMRRLLGAAMFVIAFALLRIAGSRTYVGLLAGTLALGAGLGGVTALVSPLVAGLHPARVETHMFVLHAFSPLGVVVSSLLAGWALDAGVPWRAPFAVVSIPSALVGAMFLLGRYPAAHAGGRRTVLSVPNLLRNPTFWFLAVAMALTAGTGGCLQFWTPSFIQDSYRASFLAGASGLAAFSTAMMIGRFGAGLAARVIPVHRLMIALCFVCASATLVLAAAVSPSVTFASLGLSGLCVACFWPGILSVATRRIAAGSATLLASLSVAGIVGLGAMPWGVGVLGDWLGLRVGLGLLPVAMVATGLTLMAAFRTPRQAACE